MAKYVVLLINRECKPGEVVSVIGIEDSPIAAKNLIWQSKREDVTQTYTDSAGNHVVPDIMQVEDRDVESVWDETFGIDFFYEVHEVK